MANYIVVPTKKFERELDKLSRSDQLKVWESVLLLEEDPFYPSLRSKRLRGKSGYFESSVNMDIRIIWNYEGGRIIVMIDVGHHDILKRY